MGKDILRILMVLLPSYFMIGKVWVYPYDREKNLWMLGYKTKHQTSYHRFFIEFEKNEHGTLVFQKMNWMSDGTVFTREDYLRLKATGEYKRCIKAMQDAKKYLGSEFFEEF